jgi:hypothetical protein
MNEKYALDVWQKKLYDDKPLLVLIDLIHGDLK